jgi:geranylgeranyl pyrophosphate synthase
MSKYSEISALVQEEIIQVEEIIRKQVRDNHPDLVAVVDLLLSSGGKRIRPTITILVGKLLNADMQKILSMASAIELLHTATLVHDDLIDESLLRRGIPTINAKWSTGATVLTGDFLFASAAEIAAETDSIEVVKQFSHSLITICNGEISQLFTRACTINKDEYYSRIYAKTASLFETSACCASLISTQGEKCYDHLKIYGREVGLAFQIVDDILDFTGAQATFGKPIGNDLIHGLITLPTILHTDIYPLDPCSQKLLHGECMTKNEVSGLIERIRSGDAISQALDEAKSHSQSAIIALEDAAPHPAHDALINIAEFIVDRAF